jgi:hypothetical protein
MGITIGAVINAKKEMHVSGSRTCGGKGRSYLFHLIDQQEQALVSHVRPTVGR